MTPGRLRAVDKQAHRDRLTAIDASFLHQEKQSSHMHVGALDHVRGPAALARGLHQPHRAAALADPALPPAPGLPAARARPAVLGGRPELQPPLPRAPHRAAAAGQRRAAARADGPDLLAAPRPLEAAVGAVDRPGPRAQPLRADLEDAPRARGRRVGRGHRDRPVRPLARAVRPARRGRLDPGARAVGRRAGRRGDQGHRAHARSRWPGARSARWAARAARPSSSARPPRGSARSCGRASTRLPTCP